VNPSHTHMTTSYLRGIETLALGSCPDCRTHPAAPTGLTSCLHLEMMAKY
jgi:hypothetical protein